MHSPVLEIFFKTFYPQVFLFHHHGTTSCVCSYTICKTSQYHKEEGTISFFFLSFPFLSFTFQDLTISFNNYDDSNYYQVKNKIGKKKTFLITTYWKRNLDSTKIPSSLRFPLYQPTHLSHQRLSLPPWTHRRPPCWRDILPNSHDSMVTTRTTRSMDTGRGGSIW